MVQWVGGHESSDVVGILCSPLVGIGLTDMLEKGGGRNRPQAPTSLRRRWPLHWPGRQHRRYLFQKHLCFGYHQSNLTECS